MSTSASISLSKYQISNVKQAITDLKSENTEYLSTMKRLINSTQDVHRDNQKLEQGIQLQRNYLLRLTEKVAKGPKLIEKSQLLNQQAIHRMKKYQRQISKQTRGVSILKIHDEIEKLLDEITKIKENTNKYKQKMDTEQSTIEEINKLNELKHDLVKMNQCLTEVAQKLITSISKLKIPSEIEKHVEELKQKMLKSDEARKKLENEDPNFQNSNSEIFAQVDEKLKQAIPILDDLESLFLSSSSVYQSLKQSSDPISLICSELVNSESSRFSQRSSARTESNLSSLRIMKNNLDSSSSLSFSEQKNKNRGSVFSKTMGDLSSMNKSEKQKLRKDKRHEKEAESENPLKDNRKSLMSSTNRNTDQNSDSESDKSNLDLENLKHESSKTKPKSQKSKTKAGVEIPETKTQEDKSKEQKTRIKKSNLKNKETDSNANSPKFNQKSENNESEYENEDDKGKDQKANSKKFDSSLKNTKSKSQKYKPETENNDSEYENEDDNGKDQKANSKKFNSSLKNTKSKSQKYKPETENNDSESEKENDDYRGKESKTGSKRLNPDATNSKSRKHNFKSESENDESEYENVNHKDKKPKKVRIKALPQNDEPEINTINSESESNKHKPRKQKSKSNFNNEDSESEQENDKSSKSKSRSKNSNSPNEDSEDQDDRSGKSKSRSKNSNSKNGSSEDQDDKVKHKNAKSKSDNEESSKQDPEKEKSNQNLKKYKSKDDMPRPRHQSPQVNKSKSENDESELKLSKKLSSLNKLTNLSNNKSADENLYATSSSQENFIFDSKSNQNENLGLSDQNQSSSKPKKIKRRKSSKLSNSQNMKSDTNNSTNVKDDDENENGNINLQLNQLSKTQPRVRIAIDKKLSNKAESDTNADANANGKKRRRKRKSTSQINDSLAEYSSSVLPSSENKKKELMEANSDMKSDSYSEAFKNDDSNTNKREKNDFESDTEKGTKLINPISNKLISFGNDNNDNKSDTNNEDVDGFVLKKKRANKENQTQKKEVDSDSDNYEPFDKNSKQKTASSKHKQKAKSKSRKSKSCDLSNHVIKAGVNKLINSTPLIKADNDNASTETYNDECETDEEFTEKKKNKPENSSKTAIFDSEGNQIVHSIFVDENGVPLNNTKVFDKEGNLIDGKLDFDEDGTIQGDKEIFDEDGNSISSIIQLNDKFEPINKKIFDANGNEIKDASKIKIDNKKKKSKHELKNKSKSGLNNEIIEEEEEDNSEELSKTNLNQDILNIFDEEQNRISNPILINSENGKPFNIKLFDSNGQLIDRPIETRSNGKPKIEVFDSNGTKIDCLISVDENGKPINPKIYDENGNPIKSLKSFINKGKVDDAKRNHKKKIKKKKIHRLFDKDNKELKNVLLINSIGKPLNMPVFNSDGEEIKSSITFNQTLYNTNKDKVDKIVEVDSLGQPSNASIFDSKGNEFTNLNFLMSKEKNESSSASLSNDENDDDDDENSYKSNKKKKYKMISVSIDENKRPINTTIFDSDGNELSVVEFDSNGEPTKHLYNKNKRQVTKIIIEDEDGEEDMDSISSLSYSSENDDLGRSKSDLDSIFCDANGNEFKNPIFVDINDKPYNNVQVYDAQCHLYNSPLKYDDKTGVPEIQIFDYQGLPFSHVVQIGPDGNPTKFTLYNINREPVTFPTLKVQKPKREKLEMVDSQKKLNIISFENPDKEEEEKSDSEKKPKKSSQTKWAHSILSSIINNQLDKTKLNVAVADANVELINLEEEIHSLEEEQLFLERKVNTQIERRDKIEKKTNFKLDCNICEFFIEPIPPPDRSELYRDVYAEGQMSGDELIQVTDEIENNSKYLADNIIFEQQKITADFHFPELEKIYYKLMSKNSKLKHVIDKLESHLNIVTSESMSEYASKETRMRVRYEDSRKEKISTMSQAESAISEGSIQINDLNNRIEDQKVIIEMLKKQIAEQQRKERPDAKKLCLELDGLRGIEKKNRENLKMLEMEQNSIETQTLKISELIDEHSMGNLQQSVDDYQKQLNDIKDSFARMRKKSVKKANPLTNKYELMGLDERIKEAKKQIADVKRKESVAVNKIDKRIKILQSYGLRIPSHKRVSNGECV